MITVLVEQETARLQYVLSELLGRRLGVAYKIITNVNHAANGVVINYTNTTLPNTIHIKPHGLLNATFLDEVQPIVLKQAIWHTILFANDDDEVPFDLFSAAFYLLTRYEEYFKNQTDAHGRFEAKSSVAYKHGFLAYPLIEHWCEALKKVLFNASPELVFAKHEFNKLSTIDIDFAYLYHGLNLKRWLGKLTVSLVKFNLKAVINQLFATLNKRYDPYNSYQFIAKNTDAQVAYFVLMNSSGKFDKNINPEKPVMRKLLRQLNKQAKFIGLHPSYASSTITQLVHIECELLEQAILQPVHYSRQHYLLLTIPQTYNNLIRVGITDDYTMAYADSVGFRASTCMPFKFFNVLTNQTTTLEVHSTCVMDVTLWNYLKLNTNEAKELTQQLLNVTKQFNGNFISLWHNNSFTGLANKVNLKEVYCAIYKANHKTN